MTEKKRIAYTVIIYSKNILQGCDMGRLAISGALFIFKKRGEKLEPWESETCNGWPDHRYVLWPRAEWWDVRYLKRTQEGKEWLPIAEKPFADESAAWLAAYSHWLKRSK
ncbi:hypothetical protein CWR40_004218 [Cronobacter sakazakii]|uniref:Uncharacterized protein n=2 Tax=Cronobacter sakazakii TaxID=28141 RepID=A0A7V7RAD6_CROSK|nr:hypothetical protein [Cronobacter sakazakii]AXW99127.2 hypothetical protein CsakCS931_34500 [Cronobacter sakazakii]EGT4283848.1 hypothetical protein [Cronobacter sakazakii]EGT4365742.1 hypothetical protein [Cronobacter sakazakii]EGT4366943.1 hypothetical protein [Cronobacter sakazakii]EIZ2434144.1 hypothetical protein [Cronobacter sakazakii]